MRPLPLLLVPLLGAPCIVDSAQTQEPAAPSSAPVTTATLKAFLAAFNAHDLDAIMGFFADDCQLLMPRGTEPWGTRYVGKPAVREGLATRKIVTKDSYSKIVQR